MANAFAKTKPKKISNSYAATKSQNEIYYQMASIFKQVVKREDRQAHRILNRLLTANNLEISLENSI